MFDIEFFVFMASSIAPIGQALQVGSGETKEKTDISKKGRNNLRKSELSEHRVYF